MPEAWDGGMIQDIMRQATKIELHTDSSDEEVLRLAQKDPDLFALLIRRYEAPFLRKAQSILYSREEAEEAVQDAFTRIYLYADRYRDQEGASFSSWAYAILTRLCFTRYQKLKKHRARTLDIDPEAYERLPDTDHFLGELSARNEVLAAFAKMPEAAASILKLQFLDGYSQEEIAEQEGLSVSAVKTRVHRAKKLFKKVVTNGNHE